MYFIKCTFSALTILSIILISFLVNVSHFVYKHVIIIPWINVDITIKSLLSLIAVLRSFQFRSPGHGDGLPPVLSACDEMLTTVSK